MAKPVIFAGPSLRGIKTQLNGDYRLLPPAQRGDVMTLLEQNTEPGIITLVDGQCRQGFPIGHQELLRAIDHGWQVWGLGGIGAIRAYELRQEGMLGYGRVYRRLRQRADLPDDQILHLFHSDSEYSAQSLPLMQLEYFLKDLETRQRIQPEIRHPLVKALKKLSMPERTFAVFVRLLTEHQENIDLQVIEGLPETINQFDIKSRDLDDFLRTRPWGSG